MRWFLFPLLAFVLAACTIPEDERQALIEASVDGALSLLEDLNKDEDGDGQPDFDPVALPEPVAIAADAACRTLAAYLTTKVSDDPEEREAILDVAQGACEVLGVAIRPAGVPS